MSWRKSIIPTRENSSLPLYDNTPEPAPAKTEPLSRREQRRLRRRTTRNFSGASQDSPTNDLQDESKVRGQTKSVPGAADERNQEQDVQGNASAAEETTDYDSSPTTLVDDIQDDEDKGNQGARILDSLNTSVYKTPPKGQDMPLQVPSCRCRTSVRFERDTQARVG